ncbi:MAG TPA: alpha/beta hydrolase family protein [Armatimonadota bacterium]|nr:alpha/beta hydrolase family protein [Armatimonadota bacterium]
MSFGTMAFFSKALGRPKSYSIILPDYEGATGGPYPVLYLLHGRSDDHRAWTHWTSLDRYVRRLPLIVVMPCGERSFYCNTVEGDRFEDYLMQDLMAHIEGSYNVLKGREHTAIGGLSMGGYGAMKLGLKFPERFGSVGAHSSAFAVARKAWDEPTEREMRRIFGPADSPARAENDPWVLAERLAKEPDRLPALYIDCGTEDFLLECNREFHAHLNRLGIAHTYQEFPGTHCWEYWDQHIQDSLAHHCKALGIEPAA